MQFEKFVEKLQAQFKSLQKNNPILYVSSVTGETLWETYLTSFKPEDNGIFRNPESTVHNGSYDKAFIRRYGNIVSVDKNGNLNSIWDITLEENSPYYNSVTAMAKLLKENVVGNVFRETFTFLNEKSNYSKVKKQDKVFQLGFSKNARVYTPEEAAVYGNVNAGQVYIFNHMNVMLDACHLIFDNTSVESFQAFHRDNKEVFKRALDNLSIDTLNLANDLITQGSLMRAEPYKAKLVDFIKFKTEYDSVTNKENWAWYQSAKINYAKFGNELIGTLCYDIEQGKDLNTVCKEWNYRVDPVNYMKATAPVTQRQLTEAAKLIEENGFTDSFTSRRFAEISDIDINEIMHINGTEKSVIKKAALFDGVTPTKTSNSKTLNFDNTEVVGIEKFINDILPTCTGIEAYFAGTLSDNLVAMTTAINPASKNLFKWSNPFSWTYNGNLTGKSMIKDNVKAAGGKITGVLRTSLQWNDADTTASVDFDLHCKTPHSEIYFGDPRDSKTGGWLDVDMINPTSVGIENITWQQQLKDGAYEFSVNCFNGRTNKGFKAEIEFGGNTFNYHYTNMLNYKQVVKIATVTVVNGVMSITHHLPFNTINGTVWNLDTNQFHKVNLVCTSPNHWGVNNTGNKHYFFMLDNCIPSDKLRTFHKEYLSNELASLRTSIELLANKFLIETDKPVLAGLGFDATVKNNIILKLHGSHERVIKLQF